MNGFDKTWLPYQVPCSQCGNPVQSWRNSSNTIRFADVCYSCVDRQYEEDLRNLPGFVPADEYPLGQRAGEFGKITSIRWSKITPTPITLREYQAFTKTTSLYKDDPNPLFLGLCEEAGEVAGKRKKMLRGDFDETLYRDALIRELGDVMWYVSEICNTHGLTIAEVLEANVAKLKDRQERGVIQGSGDLR